MRILNLKIISLFLIIWGASLFSQQSSEKVSLTLFWGNGCPHCEKERIFLNKLQSKYPFLEIKQYEVWANKDNLAILEEVSKKLKIKSTFLPITIIQDKHYIIGFQDEKSTGVEIEEAILKIHNLKPDKNGQNIYTNGEPTIPDYVTVPLFGEVKIKSLSLPLLTIVLGAIDGFNPCAMWVLIMLLSFLISINDRKKLIIYGGVFLLTSGAVYFMFMMAWLNLILFIGYIPIVKLIIGSVAIIGGAYYIKEFFKNKENVCKVTGSKQKKKITEKITYYIEKKGYWISILAIIVLAFFINLVEGICSAGIPAVYTQVLAMSSLSPLAYYLYILLYLFVFLLGSIIVFSIAVLSLKLSNFTTSIGHYFHLIGGVVLLIIGTLLIFKPQWLMLG